MVLSLINHHQGTFDNSKHDGSCIETIAACN